MPYAGIHQNFVKLTTMSDLMEADHIGASLRVVPGSGFSVSAVILATGSKGPCALIEFFVATLRNPHTRLAYAKAVSRF